jgi:two-component system chemotaxis response regulator CheY
MKRPTEKSHVRILVVDDHHLTREMVRIILKGIGFDSLISVESAFEARELIKAGGIDLVICDWNMPRFSGLELLREVRAMERHKDMPFLMLTAEAYRESLKEAMKAGVTDYIAKPFTAEILQEKLERVLNLSE